MGAAVNEGRCQVARRCLRRLRLAVTEHIKRRRWRTWSADVRVVLGSNRSAHFLQAVRTQRQAAGGTGAPAQLSDRIAITDPSFNHRPQLHCRH